MLKWPDIFPKYLVLGIVPGRTASTFSQIKILLDLFSQSLLANLLHNALRLMTQKSATFHSQHYLADFPQIGLRVNTLISAS